MTISHYRASSACLRFAAPVARLPTSRFCTTVSSAACLGRTMEQTTGAKRRPSQRLRVHSPSPTRSQLRVALRVFVVSVCFACCRLRCPSFSFAVRASMQSRCLISLLHKMSRFSACPVCSRLVANSLINDHLDSHLTRSAKRARREETQATAASTSEPLVRPAQRLQVARPTVLQQPDQLSVVPSRHGSAKRFLSDHELRDLSPCEVVRSALPAALANDLLESLLEDSKVRNKAALAEALSQQDVLKSSMNRRLPKSES